MTFLTFPTLSDLDLFSGVTYGSTRGQSEFLSFQQYNLERRKVGKGGRVEVKGVGSGWSRQTCQLHTYHEYPEWRRQSVAQTGNGAGSVPLNPPLTSVPQYDLGQIPGSGSGDEAKCDITVQFLTFSCIIFFISWIQEQSLDSMFVQTQFTKFRICNRGWNP